MNTHIDDVTAIAFSPDKRLVATGEIGAKPMICIWDALTMQLKFPPIKGKLTKGIQSLSFSSTGKTLAAVAIDPDHTVAVINVDTGTVIATSKGDVNEILDIAMKDDLTFSTAGIKHFKQWTVG
jgi:echinoderm microtubule-associated protein-like 6